jgi:hypothetical protein
LFQLRDMVSELDSSSLLKNQHTLNMLLKYIEKLYAHYAASVW